MENYKAICDMTERELLSDGFLTYIFETKDEIMKVRLIEAVKERAKLLGCLTKANAYIRAFKAEVKKETLEKDYGFDLERNGNTTLKPSIYNFEQILRNDEHFSALSFNTLSRNCTFKDEQGVRLWTDLDDAAAYSYIYEKYRIYAPTVCKNAVNSVMTERSYNPVVDLIKSLEWDGRPRMKYFLEAVMLCDSSDYVREVSRLIFAGGIHRIFSPGCKFDTVPVFIGKQGEGKSTIVRWLAMEDEFYSEVFTIEDRDGMEYLQGKWICELGELIAVTRAKEVEAVKSFLSRQSDYYRRAYDARPYDYKRSCIFIGTTNRNQFLTDKTGNRRYLPVRVKCNGYEIFKNEKVIKEYIRQCWAEAYTLYKKGELPPYSDSSLFKAIKEAQEFATEMDYRIDLIKEYIENKDKVCVLQIWENALDEKYSKPTRKDSTEIGLIMQQMDGWERSINPIYIENYGHQRGWKRL